MKNKKTIYTLVFAIIVAGIMVFSNDIVRAQAPTVRLANYSGPLKYSVPKITYFPPLSTGMPFDVMIAYIYLDSIARTVPIRIIDSAYGDYRMTNKPGAIGYSDTLQYVAKYLYEMDDYDPIRFSQYSHLFAPGTRYLGFGLQFLTTNLMGMMAKKFPDSLRTTQLCASDYIAEVQVAAIDTMTDPDTSILPRTAFKITCNILDLVKGQVTPACIPDTFYGSHKGKLPTITSTPSCIQFEYRLQWTRLNHGDFRTQDDSTFLINGHPWIQLDSEYIVYLKLQNLGYDTVNSYFTIIPSITASNMGGMYPVNGGVVSDPYDDMGFGQGLSVTNYKTSLRSKIYSITHP